MEIATELPKVGNTPLVRLKSGVHAKLEWANPFGSLKDRAALWMVRKALESGALDRGKVLVEPSSGNTGIALSGIARALGLRAQIITPDKVSPETKDTIKYLGAELMETPDDLCPRVGVGTEQCIALAKSFVESRPEIYYMPNQYENMANFRAHYESTGPEIERDLPGADLFIAGVGTGGTLTGAGLYLKERTGARIVAVQPEPNHKIQGLRNLSESAVPKVLEANKDVIDDWVTVSNREAFEAVRELALNHGMYVGPSSGAVYSALSKLELGRYHKVVLLFGDSGAKYRSLYLSEGVFTEEELERYSGFHVT